MTGNVGIIGRARVGKDTAGAWLVENRGYVRVGFADAVRDVALRLDPIVGTDDSYLCAEGERLSDAVSFWGWETAKGESEVRRILQETGMAVRAIDPDFWLRIALEKVAQANAAGSPVVITDVRFPNEAESLRNAGFHLLYIDRPDVEHLEHPSEGALTSADAEFFIYNTRDKAAFLEDVEFVANVVRHRESMRQTISA